MKEYKIYCDRCGKAFRYTNEKWASKARLYKLNKLKITKLFYGNSSGYDYSETTYELCSDCTKDLCDWIRGKKNERNQNEDDS